MDALAAWLKQIVLVVLLATFIDLLLPNRGLQRYVKLVVSLFILMTILSPVMNLLGSSANLRMLAAAVEGWDLSGLPQAANQRDASGPDVPPAESLPALSEVIADGEAIGAKQAAESLELLELRMESMVREQLESQHGVAVLEADAALSLDRDGFPVIDKLTVVYGSRQVVASNDGESGEPWTMEPVKPVDPVDVRINVKDQPPPQNAVPAISGEGNGSKETQGKRQEIIEALSKQWNVDARRIELVQHSGVPVRE